MNKNITSLLCVRDTKLANLSPVVSGNMKQATIADLSAHLGIARRSIENDVDLFRFLARQNRLNNRFRLEKIIPEKFCRRDLQTSLFNAYRFFFLRLTRTRALLFHQFFKTCNIES